MKIAIVHSFYRSGPSGENIAVRMQAKALTEAGHEVKIISRSTDDFINQRGYALSSALTVASGFGPSPLEEINDFDPHIVHVHNLFPNWGDRWVEKLAQPLVVTIHNFRALCAAGTLNLEGSPCTLCPAKGSHHSLKNKCYQRSTVRTVPLSIATASPGNNRLINRADHLIFLHPQVRSTFVEHLPHLSIKRATVVPNFLEDVSGLDIPIRPKSLSRAWIFVGRLSPEKGILPLVKAWPGSEKLRIVGGGPLENDLRLAAAGKQIEILGEVAPGEIPRFLATAKGMVFPSVWLEHGPLTFLEALRAGMPVLAKGGSSPAELVRTHECGVVFSDFSEVPQAIIDASELLTKAGQNSRNLYESLFTEKIWIQSITGVYLSLG